MTKNAVYWWSWYSRSGYYLTCASNLIRNRNLISQLRQKTNRAQILINAQSNASWSLFLSGCINSHYLCPLILDYFFTRHLPFLIPMRQWKKKRTIGTTTIRKQLIAKEASNCFLLLSFSLMLIASRTSLSFHRGTAYFFCYVSPH